MGIGDNDQRVGTQHCIALAQNLAAAARRRQPNGDGASVELVVEPSEGHAPPANAYSRAAEFLIANIVDRSKARPAHEPQPEPLSGPYASPVEGRRVYGDTLEKQLEQLANDPQMKRFRESRARLADDTYRPIYHYVNPEGRHGDPDGLCRWQGNYHLFYQAFPPEYPRQHWGHAYSPDLVHWKDLPLALYPDIEQACYSGSTLVEADRVIAMYHGYPIGNMIATASDPLLLNWKKWPDNPVIPGSPHKVIPGAKTLVFDPCIWKEDDGYYSISGLTRNLNEFPGAPDRIGPQLYYSKDLKTWQYLHCLVDETEKFTDYGESSACPYFWPIGDPDGKTYILLFFGQSGMGQYLLGQYDRRQHRFAPFHHGRFNTGMSRS